jgi:hypothetical protein
MLSVFTRISSVGSPSLIGDWLPDGVEEEGEGYLRDASRATGGEEGNDGELERTERGDEGGDDGWPRVSMMFLAEI